jgi:hypothetical protein
VETTRYWDDGAYQESDGQTSCDTRNTASADVASDSADGGQSAEDVRWCFAGLERGEHHDSPFTMKDVTIVSRGSVKKVRRFWCRWY